MKPSSFLKKAVVLLTCASLILVATTFFIPATPAYANDPYMDRNVPTDGMTNADLSAMNQHEIAWLLSQNQILRDSYQVEKDFQRLIDRMAGRHGDASPLDIALGTYDTGLVIAQSVHDQAAKVIGAQWGFNAKGQVTNRAAAIQTVTDARAGLRDTHYRLVLITHNLHRTYADWHYNIIH